MKGKDVRCPKCGEGTDEIAPDHDTNPRTSGELLFSIPTQRTTVALCRNGHRLWIEGRKEGRGWSERVTSEVPR